MNNTLKVPPFVEAFREFACDGDTIESVVTVAGWRTGLRLVATLYNDDDATAPDKRQDGFWPSLDPESDGYIGDKSKAQLTAATRRASHVMNEWKADNWFYVGVAVRAYFDDIPLTGEFDHALWGVECNYPTRKKSGRNAYLRDVANEQAEECVRAAIRQLTAIVEAGAEIVEGAE